MSEKSKCANCGKELNVEPSPDFKMYCNDSVCNGIFVREAMNLNKSTRRKLGWK